MSFKPYEIDYDALSSMPDSAASKLVADHYLVLVTNTVFSDKKALIKFAGKFGNPIRFSLANLNKNYSAIEDTLVRTVTYNLHNVEINNDKQYTGRAAWHIDTKWTDPQIHIRNNILYGKKVPADSSIGNTIYAHTGLMFADMPEHRKQYLRTLTIKHARSKTSLMYEKGYVGRNISEINDDFYIRSEPLIQTDENGNEYMYLSEQDAWCIDGMDDAESEMTIKQLASEIRTTEHQYRHRWQPNQMLVSVNPVFPHVVTDDFDPGLREMWRIWIK
jgi:alpha-ketoglutarate-dependent taurine dioxygenase